MQKIAPFLVLDEDPYPVVSDGRIVWIQDAYTVSDRYPYSSSAGGNNYIRNSVKAVIDAYQGSVTFYSAERADPIGRHLARAAQQLAQPSPQRVGILDHFQAPGAGHGHPAGLFGGPQPGGVGVLR